MAGHEVATTGNVAREYLEKQMKHYRPMALAIALVSMLGLGSAQQVAAGPLLAKGVAAVVGIADATTPNLSLVKDPPSVKNFYRNQNNRRYKQRNKKHRRHNKKRFYNPGVYLDGGYNNRYGHTYDPYYQDPYYDPAPNYGPARYSCGEIRRMLRQRGYRNIRAHDCTGKVYTFVAFAGHKRYKLRVRSKNGSIKTRKRL